MPLEVRGLGQFISHVGKVATEARKLDETVVGALAFEAKVAVLGVASSELPGRRLSRFNRGKGITLSASYKVVGGASPSATLYPTPPGPWYLLEGGGKAHAIGIRSAKRGGKRGGPGFLGNAAAGFAAVGPVQHPEIAAKHTWEKAAAAGVKVGEVSFAHVQRQAYLKMFAG